MNDQLRALKKQAERNKKYNEKLDDSRSAGAYENDVILNLIERVEQLEKQNYHYREAIIEAMDLGLYGDSEDGIITMYNILNEALGSANEE